MRRINFFLFIVAVTAAINFFAAVDAREWTSKLGHKFEAEFVKLSNGTVYLKTASGDEAEVKFKELSDDDKNFVISKSNESDSIEKQPDALTVVKVAAGRYQSFFITKDGTLWGMGNNYLGRLGVTTYEENVATPVRVMSGVADVTTDNETTFVLKKDGTLLRISDGKDNSHPAKPIVVANDVITASAANGSFAWIKRDGSLWAGGQKVVASDVKFVGLGGTISNEKYGPRLYFYIKNDDTLYCNRNPLLLTTRNLHYKEKNQYMTSYLMSNVAKVNSGECIQYATSESWNNFAILKTDGTLWTYKSKKDDKRFLTQIETDVVDISVGTTKSNRDQFCYYIKKDGRLFSLNIAIDADKVDIFENVHIPVSSLVDTEVIQVSAGWESKHLLHIKKDGTLWAMGWNSSGELGIGYVGGDKRTSPVQVKIPLQVQTKLPEDL
ncbi:MAG: hypothetical protein LBG58_13855 [Planctomycetaceae bacterium]|jgi:alpha-tubulin suppressor-like RCC1 family protein|nr:hypothetical protein [Planctomycetaceae bacterium]